MRLRTIQLEDVFWFQEGPGIRKWQFTNSGIKLLNVGNILPNGEIDLTRTDRFLSREEVEGHYRHFLLDEGDLVIASSGISFDDDRLLRTRGAFVRRSHLPLCLNTSTIRFKRKGDADLRYLRFWLNSHEFRSQITRLVTGSAQQNFGPSHLQNIRLTIPSLPEQQIISDQLEQAEHLCHARRYALQLSDNFLSAAFLQYFGNPVHAERGWELARLDDLCGGQGGIKAGPFGSSLKKESYVSAGIRVYGQEQVIAGDFSIGDYYISEQKFSEFASYEVRPGDVLVSLVGTFGRAIVVPHGVERGIINPRLLKLSPLPERLHPTFLANLIEHPLTQRELARISHGGTMGILNASLLRELRVIAPPLAIQQNFIRLVEGFGRVLLVQREALRQAEHLFQSLLHSTFANDYPHAVRAIVGA